MKVVPYLYFNGNAKEAIVFYAEAFKGAEVQTMTYGDRPEMPESAENGDKILHSMITVGSEVFYISDSLGERETTQGSNIQINLNCDSEDEINFIYEKLSQSGAVIAPLADTFWGARFGMLKDKFGVFWSLNYQKTEH